MTISTLRVPDYTKTDQPQLYDSSNVAASAYTPPSYGASPIEQIGAAAAKAAPATDTTPVNGWQQLGTTTATIGSAVISRDGQTNANYASQKYQSDYTDSRKNQAAQFGPLSGATPQYEAPPSKTEQLSSSTWLGGSTVGKTAGAGAEQVLLNPAGALGDEGGYVGETAIQGAMQGYASDGSWESAVVGGVIGAIEAIFGWSNAEDEDKATQAKAKKEYERELMQWTIARNQQLAQSGIRRNQEIIRQQKTSRQEAKTLQLEGQKAKGQSIEDRRAAIWNALSSASGMQSNRQRQLASTPY